MRMFCGYLVSEAEHGPLITLLPPVLTLAVRDGPAGAWLESAIRFVGSERAARRAGSDTVVSKLSELLFVEAVRRYIESLPPDQTGWFAGLADPTVGRALGVLHGSIAHPWTTEELAGEVGLSRSAFADRFTQLVGEPPMRYLTLWRLRHAKVRLLESHHPIARIAFDVGYESEAAFTRAFKREFGAPPAAWRRQASA